MIARLALLCLVLTVCACDKGRDEAPFAASRLAPGAPASAWPPAGWAWGYLKLGKRPALRYGVAAPEGVPAGDVVILPGYGTSAEWWFETANQLVGEGYTVWIMDGAGQGGSGRYAEPRDLGHVPDFETDIQGLQALIRVVVRPAPGSPVKVIAAGTAAMTALAAAERHVAMDRLILSAPEERTPGDGGPGVGTKTMRARGETPWSRPDPSVKLSQRRKTALGWAVANPDLRMGGPSIGWYAARRKLLNATLSLARLSQVGVPVTVITGGGPQPIPCARLKHCLLRPLPADLPYEIEGDAAHGAWLSALTAELAVDHTK